MKKNLVCLVPLLLVFLLVFAGCRAEEKGSTEAPTTETAPSVTSSETSDVASEEEMSEDAPSEDAPSETPTDPTTEERETAVDVALLNGEPLDTYVIIYGADDLDYSERAAYYIQEEIEARTGVSLAVRADDEGAPAAREIVVGETTRAISAALDADTEGVEFAFMADGGSIALEGDYFVIAAAAYYFIDTYVTEEIPFIQIPETVTVCAPIVEKPKNYIFLIGDGMGINQTLLFDVLSASNESYSDGEDFFYGYMLPTMGLARTTSLSGLTDSAAAGTALASGYKTLNGFVGKTKNTNDVPSLTELAGGLGMATAVMSTESQTGATPSAFSAHCTNRNDGATILASQEVTVDTYGTIINCGFDYYDANGIAVIETKITETLGALSQNQNGFFLMYEEAHIDKHCHSNDLNSTFKAVVRFNQAIGVFMEYAFYNPDTFVLITADHETGGLLPNDSRSFSYSHGNHTSHYVPVFAYGEGSECFDGIIMENIQIPKTIAAFFGVEVTGTTNSKFPSLAPIANTEE